MGSSRRATTFEANQKIQEIRALHALGHAALQLPPGLPTADQALELGCSAAKLAVARRFALPTKGYSLHQLDELCEFILKHRPVFGVTHVEILLAIPWLERDTFQRKCIRKNWSRRRLMAEKTKHFRPRSQGG